jgi:SAM-dependent methyltransferase
MKPPIMYARSVRETLRWLVQDEWVDRPLEAQGEARYLLYHAERLHASLGRLPAAGENTRCLVVGSWGLEVPYLYDRLGWRDVTCLCAPTDPAKADRTRRQTRNHPNGDRGYDFTLIEHDVEGSPLPFEANTFGLVVYWGCLEHLRHDPELSLYEINRVCAPGAVVSLHWPPSEGHWRLYTPWEIRELLQGTGWRVDLMTSIVPDPSVYWKWWKRWIFKRVVGNLRVGFGLEEPYWNAFILAHATKVAMPTRSYPTWLYKDEKIRQLKVWMMELVSSEAPTRMPARRPNCAPRRATPSEAVASA